MEHPSGNFTGGFPDAQWFNGIDTYSKTRELSGILTLSSHVCRERRFDLWLGR